MRIPFRILFIALFMMTGACPAGAQSPAQPDPATQARIAELQKHVDALEAQERSLDAQILATGGSASAPQGIRDAEARRGYDAAQVEGLRHVVEAYTHSVMDMEELHRQAQNLPLTETQDFGDRLKSKAEEDGVKLGLEAAGATGAAEAVGPILLAAKFVKIGGRWCIRKIDSAGIRDDLMAERVHLNDVLGDVAKLDRQESDEIVRKRQLEEMDRTRRKLEEELVPARHRLATLTGQAHYDANLHRERDDKGDAEEEAKMHYIRIRRCGDWQPERNPGVHASSGPRRDNKKADTPEKIGVKDDDARGACTDITGNWTFQTTSFLSAKPMPPVRAEIARKEQADIDPPAYEIFMPDKEHAQKGPFMRCTLSEGRLDCQVIALSTACPPEKQVWDKLEMTLSDDGNALSGEYLPGYASDGSAPDKICSAVHFDWPGKKTYRFVPARQ